MFREIYLKYHVIKQLHNQNYIIMLIYKNILMILYMYDELS